MTRRIREELADIDRRDRRLMKVLIVMAVALLVLLFFILPAPAVEVVCPQKLSCWKVRAAVATFGEAAAEAHVRACGWSDAQIQQAKRCLK